VSCCPQTIAFLASIGCAHAARMHERDAGDDPADWPAVDWLQHMREERDHLWPRLRKTWPDEVAHLETDHLIFVAELRAHGRILSLGRMRAHSQLEDRLIVEYLRLGGT
jgi:hypothetical protein